MNSIRTKMFLAFFGIILAIIIVFIVFNAFLYKEYIIKSNELEFEKISKEISKIYYSNDDYLKSYIRNISMNKGIQIDIIYSKNQTIVYSTRGSVKAFGKNVVFQLDEKSDIISKNTISQVDSEIGEIFIKSFKLSDDYTIVMYKPFVMIYDRVKSSTKFIMLVALFIMLPGIILVNYTTKRHVKPILELHEQTTKMAKLDFSSRFKPKSNDEISVLGENVNNISDKLSATIDELESDIEKLSKVDDLRRQFLASVSHELKTPLSIIRSYAESIKMGIVKGEEDEYLDTIIDEVNRLNEMVRKLTSTYKMGFVNTENLTRVNLAELINEIADRHNRKDKGLIAFVINKNVSSVVDDKSIIQVLDNFIVNAKKHMTIGSKIIITLDKKEDNAFISVFNEGSTISEDKRAKIWDEFYKVDKSRKRGEAGSGLGLFINKSIIEWYGGTYGFNNKENGVEFFFTLKTEA